MERHYFDWAATAIPQNNTMLLHNNHAYFSANPSSVHREGKTGRKELEEARFRSAEALGVKPEEIIFTSGGTESNLIVLYSLLLKSKMLNRAHTEKNKEKDSEKSAVLLYSSAEHPSIRENMPILRQLGIPCAPIGTDRDGTTSETMLQKALTKNPGARMAAIMAVNNETGAINNLEALSDLLRRREEEDFPPIHIHCDAVQAAGKIPLDFRSWGINSAAISAHKMGGSRGIGILWLKSPIALNPLFRGGGQENNIRPGTENTQGAQALADVLEKYALPFKKITIPSFYCEAAERMKMLIRCLYNTGSFIPLPEDRSEEDSRFSPWILQGAFRNKNGKIIPGEVLVRTLDEKGFAVSTGSACSSREIKRPVLEAMGINEETRLGGIRISQGYSTTMEEIKFLIKAISELLITL